MAVLVPALCELLGCARRNAEAVTGGPAQVTGCLARQEHAGSYQVKTGSGAVIDLTGLDDLKNHVGQQVTVYGTWSRAEAGDKDDDDDEREERAVVANRVTVVSPTCAPK
jgi:hypothetical protein